ncbi:MAG: protein translocase subunit SecD [Frankiales bacterium]|nr:protein translocase subunit SecD [Frankiales bacterium]
MTVAAPTQRHTAPGRTLAILGAFIVLLGAWTFWPGESHTPKLGLDLRGGTQVILTPVPEPGTNGTVSDDQLNQTVEIIRQRVDGFGVAEAEVTTQGSGANASILVSIPGTTNQQILDSLATTAKLDFRPVLEEAAGAPTPTASPTPSATGSGTASPSASPSATASSSATASATASSTASATASSSASGNGAPLTAALRAGTANSASPSASPSTTASPSPSASGSATVTSVNGLPPIQSSENNAELEQAYQSLDCSKTGATKGGPADPNKFLVTCSKDGAVKYLLDKAAVQGTEIASASAGINTQGGGGWEVNLTFTSTGAEQFATVTGQLAQKPSPQNQFGIVLDGLVESSPYVSSAILGGSAVITGSFTADEAKALANVLKYGSLPVTLEVSSVEQISPTLGQDQLDAGLIAGALGLLLVVIYLVIYYRALGLVAVASLLVAGAISYGLFVVLGRQLGFALSLAGVAGAIVAIGITADSFVVYFERIRDEIREGRSLRAAGDAGWIRARRTILAADFVSFLAAIVLYFLSVGSVRGFAFTLGLTTLVDVAVAFLFTRPLVSILMRTAWFTSGSHWTGLSPDRLGVKPEVVPVAARPVKEPS